MGYYLNCRLLADCLRVKRGKLSYREASEQIGDVGSSTICRTETGRQPGLEAFFAICDWLELPPQKFIENDEVKTDAGETTCDRLNYWIDTDPQIDPVKGKILKELIKAVYKLRV